jgi:MFS transporter, ACS family, hexuronate transporter
MQVTMSTESGLPAGARSYQWALVGLLSLNFGIVFFDRNALSFLMPFIQPELGLSNTKVGALASALSFSWALAGLFIGRISDMLGRRKLVLVFCTVVFSCASFISGLAGTFATLLIARLVMGFAEGGVMPISQALIAAEVDPARRGVAMGVTQNFGANLLGNFLAPVAMVAIATAFGWRRAFYFAALPGLLMAFLIYQYVREPTPSSSPEIRANGSMREGFAHPNVIVCTVISVLLVGYLLIFYTFMPLILIQERGLDRQTMSWLMASFGLVSMAYAVLIPGASDIVGRRPVMICVATMGALVPLCVLFSNGSTWQLFAQFAAGAVISGVFPLAMATIPTESVDRRLMATVMGLTMGIGEILGGVFGPMAGGLVADRFGLSSTLWILVGLTLAAALFSLMLSETAPRVTIRRARASSPSAPSTARNG